MYTAVTINMPDSVKTGSQQVPPLLRLILHLHLTNTDRTGSPTRYAGTYPHSPAGVSRGQRSS